MSHSIQQRGFTMVEIIITLAVLSFGVLGVYSALQPLIALSYNYSYKLTAAYLAQEGMEITRNIRDNNIIAGSSWSAGLLSCTLGCQADYKTGTATQTFENQLKSYDDTLHLSLNQDGFYSYDVGGTPTLFRRKIIIMQDGVNADSLKITVQVFWNYSNQPFSFSTAGYLYNWK